jgi:hypothetical protein
MHQMNDVSVCSNLHIIMTSKNIPVEVFFCALHKKILPSRKISSQFMCVQRGGEESPGFSRPARWPGAGRRRRLEFHAPYSSHGSASMIDRAPARARLRGMTSAPGVDWCLHFRPKDLQLQGQMVGLQNQQNYNFLQARQQNQEWCKIKPSDNSLKRISHYNFDDIVGSKLTRYLYKKTYINCLFLSWVSSIFLPWNYKKKKTRCKCFLAHRCSSLLRHVSACYIAITVMVLQTWSL